MTDALANTRLARLLAYHENAAATLRAALKLLASDPAKKHGVRTNGHAHPIAEAALKLDAARRATRSPRRLDRSYTQTRRARREQTAKYLAQYSPDEPRALLPGQNGKGVTTLIRWGYLKKTKRGYVRTEKAFTV